jgi:TolA-binding protein
MSMRMSRSMRTNIWFEFLRLGALVSVMTWTASGIAQETDSRMQSTSQGATGESAGENLSDSVRELRTQVRELQGLLAGMRSDWERSNTQTAELRRELDEIRAGAGVRNAEFEDAARKSEFPAPTADAGSRQNTLANGTPENQPPEAQEEVQKEHQKKSDRGASLDEEYQLLSGKVDDQYQTKVESASKYRLRLSGIVLMNLVSNQGVVDNIDLPTLAYARQPGYPAGSFGATLRQSEIGLEAFGPTLAGAKTRADLQIDLAGGFTSVPNGINSGLMRLRTGTMRMDWTNTSVVVGQDMIFFSPDSPTSFASLAVPALSSAGNLWSWVPQIRVEHKVSLGEESSLLFQGGILDPVSGEAPVGTYYRHPGPGEASRQPAYGTRIAWTRNIFGQPLRVGVGGYYSRQDYGFNRNVNGWAAMSDIELPLGRQFSFNGKLYRGAALGGLYAGIGRSVLFSGDPTMSDTRVEALNSIGGWAQLKYRPANKWEFNAAFGMDNPFARDLEYFRYAQAYGDPTLARNQAGFVNMIYRPRSDLLFSAEYRHLTTYTITNGNSAGQLNLMMGVLF